MEINPPFFDGSMENLLDLTIKCRLLAEHGFIEVAADAHHSGKHFYSQERMSLMGLEPLAPIQLKEMALGQNECVAFYQLYEDF